MKRPLSAAARMKGFRIAFFVGIIVTALGSGAAHAGSATGRVRPYFWDGWWYLDISATTRSGNPACVTRATVGTLAYFPGDAQFPGILAVLIAAWYSGGTIQLVDNTSTCDGQGDEIFDTVAPAS